MIRRAGALSGYARAACYAVEWSRPGTLTWKRSRPCLMGWADEVARRLKARGCAAFVTHSGVAS